MSEPVTSPINAPNGAVFTGFATIREIAPPGMITLRAKPGLPGLAAAVGAVTQGPMPATRQIVTTGAGPEARSVAWMGPDEYLLILPPAEVVPALRVIGQTLAGQHHLAADVSSARAVFRIEGAKADQVLRKLTPADLDAMAEGEIRRTRLAQVAAAFWAGDGGWTLVAFRSVSRYVMDLLSQAARPGSEID